MPDAVRDAIASEIGRLSELDDPIEQVRAVSDFFAALDVELEQVAAIRLEAVRMLRARGMTYEQIAEATGLGAARVAQLAREVRAGGRAKKAGAHDA